MEKRPPSVRDGGWGWLVLVGTFTGQLLYAGSCTLVGIYLVEWQEHFSVGAAAVSVIATELNIGVSVMGVFAGACCKRYGCRMVMIAGASLGITATFFASFTTEMWHLHIFGVVAGIGYGTAYMPTIIVIRFYFKKRLGFANGISFAGIGAGFFLMAPLLERLCSEYGWRGALMIQAAINANLLVCGIIFRPTRLEKQAMEAHRSASKAPSRSSNEDLSPNAKYASPSLWLRIVRNINDFFSLSQLLKNPLFTSLIIASIIIICGHISVLVYTAPKLVYDLGLPKLTASLVLSVYGICSLVSRALHGFLLDFKLISVTNLFLLSLVVAGIYPLFGSLTSSLQGQIGLVVIHGIGTGVMIATSTLVCRQFVPLEIASNALGLLVAVGGVGVVMGTQLGGRLYDATGSYVIPFLIDGVGFWACAVTMAFIIKCSCWKERGSLDKKSSKKDEKSRSKDGIDDVVLDQDDDDDVRTGYRRVRTVSDIDGNDIESRM